jgi:hypothetical protein
VQSNCAALANRCKYQRKRMAAFEISAENRKKRENNKREQARPKKISDLSKASDFISQQSDT